MTPERLMRDVAQLLRTVTIVLTYLAAWGSIWLGLRGAGRLWRARRAAQVAETAALLRAGGGKQLLTGGLAVFGCLLVIPPLMKGLRPVGLVALLLLLSRLLAGLVAYIEARSQELAEAEPELADPVATATRSLALATLPPFLGWLYAVLVLVQGLGAEVQRMTGQGKPSHQEDEEPVAAEFESH